MVEKLETQIRYSTAEQMASSIYDVRSRYESLINSLSNLGSEVKRDRLRERDQDIPPYSFYRRGTIEFVFPQQETSLKNDGSKVVDANSGYRLWTENQEYNYDPDKVRGHLRIEYEDAGNSVIFTVSDVLGESNLHDEVKEALQNAFKEPVTSKSH